VQILAQQFLLMDLIAVIGSGRTRRVRAPSGESPAGPEGPSAAGECVQSKHVHVHAGTPDHLIVVRAQPQPEGVGTLDQPSG
jgi:hypothetical protein